MAEKVLKYLERLEKTEITREAAATAYKLWTESVRSEDFELIKCMVEKERLQASIGESSGYCFSTYSPEDTESSARLAKAGYLNRMEKDNRYFVTRKAFALFPQ